MDKKKLTRPASIKFHLSDVRKPLASGVAVTGEGNGVWLDNKGGYIVNMVTKEKMQLRVEDGTYVFDVELDDGTVTTVTFDTGAGVNVWPKEQNGGNGPISKRDDSVRMAAANGTSIQHYGQKNVIFRGLSCEEGAEPEGDFSGRM